MDTITRTKANAAVFALAMATLAGTSSRAADVGPPHKIVRFADLNIDTQEGAKVLYHRIRVAAASVCEISAGGDPIMREGTRKCIDTAIDNAVKKVNTPYLNALRFGGNGNIQLASK
jgi:UrcA family protein